MNLSYSSTCAVTRNMPKTSSSLFASALGGGGGAPSSTSSSLLSSVLSGGASLDADAQLLVRKLGKKDAVTKLKALRELHGAVSERGADWSAALLPHWVLAFGRLCDDGSWQVREQSCVVLDTFAQLLRRQLAPQLKLLIAPWLRCRFDPQHDVRRAAIGAFTSAFPAEGKYASALAFCQEDLLVTLAETAFASPPARSADEDANAEAAEMYARRVSTALQAACHLLATAATEPAKGAAATGTRFALGPLLSEHVLTPALWQLGTAKLSVVRCALYAMALALLQHAPELADAHQEVRVLVRSVVCEPRLICSLAEGSVSPAVALAGNRHPPP